MNNIESSDLEKILQKSALLSSLTPEELRILARRAARKRYHAGESLFAEGEISHGLILVASGRVRIFKTSVSGREQVLAVNVPGELVAELTVFDGGKYPASALATEDTQIVLITQRDFQSYCIEHPKVALKMLAMVGARLRRLVALVEELSFTTVRQRLVAALIRLARTEGKKTEQGIEFFLPGTHQELAHELGTVREIISRNLMRLQAEGLLDVDARRIVVKNLSGMQALLEPVPPSERLYCGETE